MTNLSNIQLFRRILRELHHVSKSKPLQSHPMYAFVSSQFKSHEVTEKRICRGENEVRHMAQTYLCLLESIRKYEDLSKEYGSKEKTTEEAANLVGLTVPTDRDS